MQNNAFFTLISTDEYFEGFRLLNESFQLLNSKYPLNVMITSDCSLSTHYKLKKYAKEYKNVIVREIKSENFYFKIDVINCYNTTFNKFQMLNFKEYDNVCFLDCDLLLFKNLDFIFDLNDSIYTYINKKPEGGISLTYEDSGKKAELSVLLTNEEKEYIENVFNKEYLPQKIKVWGGIFVMNCHKYDFNSIKQKYQKTAFPTDEFVLFDIIIKDEKLFNRLNDINNVFKRFCHLTKEDDNFSLYYIHYKFWKDDLYSSLSENKKKEFITKLCKERELKNDIEEFLFNFLKMASENTLKYPNREYVFSSYFKNLLIESLISLKNKTNDIERCLRIIFNLILIYDTVFTDDEVEKIQDYILDERKLEKFS